MFEAYGKFWKNYVNFGGKSSRGDYWWVILINIIISVIFGVVTYYSEKLGGTLEGLYSLATIIPGLALTVRRLRDGGHSWANIFWAFLPIIGEIILIVKLCDRSK